MRIAWPASLAVTVFAGVLAGAGTPTHPNVIAEETSAITRPAASDIKYLAGEKLFPKVLDQKSKCDLTGTSLTAALRYLGERHKVQILLNRIALNDSGIPVDIEVSVKAQD